MEAGRPTIGLKEKKARLLRIIEDCKLRIEAEVKRYKSALKNLKAKIKRYDAAYSKYVKRPNTKNHDIVYNAASEVRDSDEIRERISFRIRTLRETAGRANDELVELLGGLEVKAANAYNTQFVKYLEKLEKLLHNMERTILDSRPDVADGESTISFDDILLTDADPVEESDEEELDEEIVEEEEEEEIEEPAPAPAPAPAPQPAPAPAPQPVVIQPVVQPMVQPMMPTYGYPYMPPVAPQQPQVNVAPVDIDVTPMVERAISSAIEQLSASLEARILEYVNTVVIPAPEVAPAAPAGVSETAGTVAEVEAHILDDEAALLEKLTEMYNAVQALTDSVTEASTTYLAVTEKLKVISETQKAVNDLQRRTMRDQQGIQVAQRVLGEDQRALTATQASIAEAQADLAEKATNLAESQAIMLDNEQILVDAHRELEGSMSQFLDAEREMIATQATIMQGAMKAQEVQRAITARQEELVLAQKEVMEVQRQIRKDQRNLNASATRYNKRKAAEEKAEETVEAPAQEAAESTEA